MSYSRILCAIDVRQPSDEVVRQARTLAQGFQARVEVVYVRRSQEDAARLFGKKGVRASSQQLMVNLINDKFEGVDAHGNLVDGDAGREIVRLAHDRKCDCIVMGSRGHVGLGKVFNPSVSDFVVRHSSLPVMTIAPARDPVELRIPDPMPNL